MVDINGYEISKAFTGGEPVNAIYSFGVKVWPVTGPVEFGGLKFTALEAGTIGMSNIGTNETTTKPYISYSKDGVNWIEWDYTPIEVDVNDVIYFKGINDSIGSSSKNYSIFNLTGKFDVSGNIMSLLYGDDYEGKLDLSDKSYCFYRLFRYCNVVDASKLIIPATTLSNSRSCYSYMFDGCKLLTEAPALPATTLSDFCYSFMFYGCKSLTEAPALPSTTLEMGCYEYMFDGCKLLTSAPALPATTLVERCYSHMFIDCNNLNYVKANFLTSPGDTYTRLWLYLVKSSGTFVVNKNATWPSSIVRGDTTVPAGWTIKK